MSGRVIFVLLLLIVSDAVCSPETTAAGEVRQTNVLQKLLAQMKAGARSERRAHLSEDQREMMTKQIVQALSEVMNSECMSDRDYQGWVDFGRRDAE
ncbi:gastrin/cholecystokinin-like peptide [Nothobranchius furzeri]|uniref:Gastrin/cholecystokinin-like peptide n=1 Tax=Nothobranchius furzeri TaxID=105023 RepID=A0A8C6K8Y2_NOTFU|nr:gastrin/cholecystokinin-like peptide [Nothobranchius furzeri]KAF7216373.1 gastrin/cholecystokinin-like peptide [Nothobranchius furzeri]